MMYYRDPETAKRPYAAEKYNEEQYEKATRKVAEYMCWVESVWGAGSEEAKAARSMTVPRPPDAKGDNRFTRCETKWDMKQSVVDVLAIEPFESWGESLSEVHTMVTGYVNSHRPEGWPLKPIVMGVPGLCPVCRKDYKNSPCAIRIRNQISNARLVVTLGSNAMHISHGLSPNSRCYLMSEMGYTLKHRSKDTYILHLPVNFDVEQAYRTLIRKVSA